MTTLHRLLPLFFLLLAGLARAGDASGCVAVVVARGSSVSDISLQDFQQILRSEKTSWADGNHIVVAMLKPGHVERQVILRSVLHMTEAEFNKYYLQAVFTGAVRAAPKALATTTALKEYMNSTPGAVGYVKFSEVDDTVKVLKVDGRLPGDDGYPLLLPVSR